MTFPDFNPGFDQPDVDIQAFSFRGDGGIEITFTEARDLTPKIGMAKIAIFDGTPFQTDVEEIVQAIRDLLDEVLKAQRLAKEAQDA